MGTGLKIFIAEDDALILEDFTITLEEMGAYRCWNSFKRRKCIEWDSKFKTGSYSHRY